MCDVFRDKPRDIARHHILLNAWWQKYIYYRPNYLTSEQHLFICNDHEESILSQDIGL